MDNEDSIIVAPGGGPSSPGIPIDLAQWARLEQRIDEIATVTPTKAPELLGTFNRAALELDRLANSLELECQVAQREADKIRAVILLDKMPQILEQKKLASSEQIRKAILSLDPELDAAMEKVELLKAMTKMIRGKYDAFERAFRSVRTLVGEQNFNFTDSRRETSGNSGTGGVGIRTVNSGGFGKPKY
jgi:hypothetical protein